MVDSTGNRRFVPIKLPNDHTVPWRRLKDERGGLWAAAVKLYREGETWEYTSGELAQLSNYQDEFLERDSWWDSISSFVADKRETTTSNVLQYAIDMPLDRVNNGHQRRVGRVMRSLGWELKSTSREVNGKRKSVRLWVNPDKTTVAGPSDF